MGTGESAHNLNDNGDDGAGDAMDRLIRRLRRRFRACESLPLFPEPSPAPATAAPPPPPGFFQLPDVGAQLRFDDPRRG